MSEPNAPKFSNRLLNIVEAISKAMLRTTSPAQVLCLQEVDEEMLSLLLRDVNLQELLPFSTHGSSSLLPSRRNQVTLSNAPFSYYSLQFEERHKLALIVSFRDTLVQVANVHLTRALTDEAVATKKCQMETLTNFLLKSPTPNEETIFAAGDFNLTTSSKTIGVALARKLITPQTAQCVREVIDPEVWDDAFLVAGDGNAEINNENFYEGEQGATFDRLINPLASMSKMAVDDRPQRYDRIIFHSGRGIHPVGFEIFGRPAEDGTFSSDHFGVCGTFQIEEEKGASENPASVQRSLENIKIADDSADIRPLIRPYLPIAADRKQREEALELLHRTLCNNQSLADLILAPLGSYAMDTYFMDSDIDVLGIASVSPQQFFNFATEQLRTIISGNGKTFKGIHFVNSVVSIIEVSILGIKFDIQYCQAAEVVKR
jgi:endonuclease/exonuclease/phosphatase family metal-dependent hydrolase